MIKKSIVAVCSVLLLLAAGCSNNTQPKKENVNQGVKHDQNQAAKISQNKDLTEQVKKEKGVISGQVYTQNNMAMGTLLLDKKVSDKDAKTLAEKYAEQLKAQYKDKKVNVQAVRSGKNVANLMK